jgi:type II secretory pathway pseudopilin PulG
MTFRSNNSLLKRGQTAGFSAIELVMSMSVFGIMTSGMLLGYVTSAQRAEWNAHALAAQSVAFQGAEQARSAKWDTQIQQKIGKGGSDELGLTSYERPCTLDIAASGQAVIVTNYVKITQVSANPAIRKIQSDCVWMFASRGWYTNTVILLRAPDQ